MSGDKEKREKLLNALPDTGCEKQDITHSMRDEANHTIEWIKDSILRRHMKNENNDRLSVKTRKLIKVKSYNTYIDFSKNIHRNLKKAANDILSEIDL